MPRRWRHQPRRRKSPVLLGAADVGQGCVVQQGLVLAVEAIEGTDAMLLRAGALRRDGIGGVLVKLVKPGQDKRADLPTIGPDTVRHAAAAGLRGLAFEGRGNHSGGARGLPGRGGCGGPVSAGPRSRDLILKGGHSNEPVLAHHAARRRSATQRRFLHQGLRHEGNPPPRRARRQIHPGLRRLWRRRQQHRHRTDLQLRHRKI